MSVSCHGETRSEINDGTFHRSLVYTRDNNRRQYLFVPWHSLQVMGSTLLANNLQMANVDPCMTEIDLTAVEFERQSQLNSSVR